jgi:hypothetical protein
MFDIAAQMGCEVHAQSRISTGPQTAEGGFKVGFKVGSSPSVLSLGIGEGASEPALDVVKRFQSQTPRLTVQDAIFDKLAGDRSGMQEGVQLVLRIRASQCGGLRSARGYGPPAARA